MASRNIVLKNTVCYQLCSSLRTSNQNFRFFKHCESLFRKLNDIGILKKTCNNGPVLFIITRLKYLDSLYGCLRSSGTGKETAVLSKIGEL